jgi:Alpha-2,8-polysialyltransferase (POLYST)
VGAPFRQLWDLGADDLHLLVESVHVNPAQAVCRIFGDARIDVYADGLMSYGPTRSALPEIVASRIERLLHLDLVPGVTPLLLSERRVPAVIIPDESFRAVAKIMIAEDAVARCSEPVAMIVGQYLAAGKLMNELQEVDLNAEMISRCAEAGYSAPVFKPHPSAPPTQLARLHHAARAHGVRLAIADERMPPPPATPRPTAESRLRRLMRRARTSLGQWLLSAPGTRRNSTKSAA